jgi:hypothetical protein
MTKDSEFLRSQNLMDYSLLLIVLKGQRTVPEATDDPRFSMFGVPSNMQQTNELQAIVEVDEEIKEGENNLLVRRNSKMLSTPLLEGEGPKRNETPSNEENFS